MSIDWKKNFEIAGIAVALMGVGAGASWTMYQDNLSTYKDQIKDYKDSEKMNYPEVLKNMSLASVSLQKRLDLLNDYDQIKKERDDLSNTNSVLTEEIEVSTANYLGQIQDLDAALLYQKDSYEQKIEKLEQEISTFKLAVTPFELKKGHATNLKSGLVQVGFSEANLDNSCTVTINNKTFDLKPGASVDVMVKEQVCKVMINRCSYGSSNPANFELICS
ncbi:hypothetical protein BCT35_23345 [Vibrio lentus]|uniref:hypothetical protein n=1 Tax=Vibrio lentus TaxID=136468 RepID=UPI000C84854F|nr:hypothetical protein [Vibrio lentus]PMN28638.1 hypothetical protein BCT35_23345 [Vibrio lentus]